MKTNFVFGILLIISIQLNAWATKQTGHKDINHFETKDFINMDLGLLSLFPTLKDYEDVIKKIKAGPKESFRLIDSIDILKITKNIYEIKVYSQNYAYISRNTYKVGLKINSDTLQVNNIAVDIKMKSNIEDAENFRVKDFDIMFSSIFLNNNSLRRIKINKDYH